MGCTQKPSWEVGNFQKNTAINFILEFKPWISVLFVLAPSISLTFSNFASSFRNTPSNTCHIRNLVQGVRKQHSTYFRAFSLYEICTFNVFFLNTVSFLVLHMFSYVWPYIFLESSDLERSRSRIFKLLLFCLPFSLSLSLSPIFRARYNRTLVTKSDKKCFQALGLIAPCSARKRKRECVRARGR